MLYRATYYSGRDQFTGATTYETRILPTRRAVELWAQDKLQGAHVVTTRDCYWRDISNAPSVTYQSVIRWRGMHSPAAELRETARARGEILPPVSTVPSVGELGYF